MELLLDVEGGSHDVSLEQRVDDRGLPRLVVLMIYPGCEDLVRAVL